MIQYIRGAISFSSAWSTSDTLLTIGRRVVVGVAGRVRILGQIEKEKLERMRIHLQLIVERGRFDVGDEAFAWVVNDAKWGPQSHMRIDATGGNHARERMRLNAVDNRFVAAQHSHHIRVLFVPNEKGAVVGAGTNEITLFILKKNYKFWLRSWFRCRFFGFFQWIQLIIFFFLNRK